VAAAGGREARPRAGRVSGSRSGQLRRPLPSAGPPHKCGTAAALMTDDPRTTGGRCAGDEGSPGIEAPRTSGGQPPDAGRRVQSRDDRGDSRSEMPAERV
jgi:hypothetical protein